MNHGFIKVAAITPKIRVADPLYNAEQVIAAMREAAGNGSRVLVFPELVLTGYTCGDLFLQQLLLEQAEEALYQVLRASKELNAISFIGTVWRDHGCLYECSGSCEQRQSDRSDSEEEYSELRGIL